MSSEDKGSGESAGLICLEVLVVILYILGYSIF